MSVRAGIGFDAHAFGHAGRLVLGGVEIPGRPALVGHSDGDALAHAIVDAVLGAVAAGDIGTHFPSSDPRWRGASSLAFLRRAAEIVAERGGRLLNVDATVILEEPRVGPSVAAMRERLAEALGLDAAAVGVKATTTDALGFTGRGEGAAALAVALVELPS